MLADCLFSCCLQWTLGHHSLSAQLVVAWILTDWMCHCEIKRKTVLGPLHSATLSTGGTLKYSESVIFFFFPSVLVERRLFNMFIAQKVD